MASLMVLSLFLPYYYTINASAVLVISFSVLILSAAVFSFMRGYVYARYFLIAWVTLLLSVIVYSLKGMGIFPSNVISAYSLQIGSAIEMSLLSLGLGSRMKNLSLEKDAVLLEISESRRLLQEEALKSAALELELLKKNIEPHFLMNSLNATVFLLREDQNSAISLLENLAGELRIMLAVSGRPLIKLEDEIELCRHHLNVMSFRKDAEYSLNFEGKADGRMIPPLILHTIIENGIRHGFKSLDQGEFMLTISDINDETVYTVENNGSSELQPSDSGGLGFRFIKAKLQEAFPGKWSFGSSACKKGWINIIRIKNQ
jgi:two-component system, sensor histidine kinase LadS